MVPYVPHLFVQRVDAVPDDALEGVLMARGGLEESLLTSGSSGKGLAWLRQLGWGNGSGDARGGRPQSKAGLRDLIKQRQDEMAADADTADYSEPYDSIPRQVQLQGRVYAKLFPEEVSTEAKLASMLGSPASNESGAQAQKLRLGSPTGEPNKDIWAAAAATFAGFLPSANRLQQTLQSLAPNAVSSHSGAAAAATAGKPAACCNGITSSASTSPPYLTAPGATGGEVAAGAGGRTGPRAAPGSSRASQDIILAGREPEYRRDPAFQQLRASLDSWYRLHWEQSRPLRRGRRARILAIRGVDMPTEWKEALRLAGEGSGGTGGAAGSGALARGLLRWRCAAMSAIGSVFGLRRGARVWDVDVGGRGCSSGQGQQQQQGQQQRQQELPRGMQGAAASGKGLVAAQAAALRMNFALRRTKLVPPEWL